MKNDFFLHRFSSNNLKDFHETLSFDVDSREYSLQLDVERQHEFFVFSSDANFDNNNYYGISSARQVRVEETRRFNLRLNGCPLKLERGHYLIVKKLNEQSLLVKNITYLVNHYDRDYVDNLDYQEQLINYADEMLKVAFNKIDSKLFWNRHNSNSNDLFLLFAYVFVSQMNGIFLNDEELAEFKHGFDEKIPKKEIATIINILEAQGEKVRIMEELKKYLSNSTPILQLLNDKRKKVTARDFFSFFIWLAFAFKLGINKENLVDDPKDDKQLKDLNNTLQLLYAFDDITDESICLHFNKLKNLNIFVNQLHTIKTELFEQNQVKQMCSIELFEKLEFLMWKYEEYVDEAEKRINIFFFYMTSPFIPGPEKNKIVEDIRNSQFAKDIQRKYNDFCATFQIPNEHKFSYEDVATTILKDSDFQHYYYEKETCNFDLTIYQIEKLYSLLRDGKYVVEDCDIRNLSCALTGKYDGDMVFKKIRWQNTHDSLALMIGLLQDKASSTSSKFHWKNLDGLFIINGVDVDGIKLNVAYNRHKRQPPKKRKEMERIIDKILSLNETVGKENEEN